MISEQSVTKKLDQYKDMTSEDGNKAVYYTNLVVYKRQSLNILKKYITYSFSTFKIIA